MRILIVNSKKWFQIDEKTKNQNEIFHINKPKDLTLKKITKINPDIIFFPHWSWYVKKEIFEKYPSIMFHSSPLPYGRGGSPIQNLILRGYKSTPVCAIKMENMLDSGKIYLKKNISLKGPLSKILKNLNLVVNDLIKKLIIKLPIPKKQIGKIEKFKRIKQSNNEIKKVKSLEEFYDRIRMLDDISYPNSFIKFSGFTLEFYNISRKKNELICNIKIKKSNV